MSLHLHKLAGCRPAPLAHYLKALGILRIIAEQADASARGWWQGEEFCLLSVLSAQELEDFLADGYSPTPFIDPWNGGSGFFPKDNKKGIDPIRNSTAVRLANYRAGITAGEAITQHLKNKPETDDKLAVLSQAGRNWRNSLKDWFDAAVVLDDSNDPSYPSLLGTGGNDGRLDFTNNAMQRIVELFHLDHADAPASATSRALLRAALWNSPTPLMSPKAAIGQFLPGDAGGANSTTGADGDSLVNAWDFLLMLEGSLVLQSRSTRRLGTDTTAKACAPFAMHAQAAGFGSPGSEKATRGEQWLPLWHTPSNFGEISALFGEARLQIGKQAANRPVDAARALSRLGTARGIASFTRYGYLERNGQANLAVPLGRISVDSHPYSRLIDDLAPWLDRLNRAANSDHAPNHLVHAERRLADAVFAALTHDHASSRWQAILLAAADIEQLQAKGSAIAAGPMPPLSAGWLKACHDNSPEWRLACALGSAAKHHDNGTARDGIRRHRLPLNNPWHFDTSDNGKKLATHSDVVMQGRDALTDLIALIERRALEASAQRSLPLNAAYRQAAQPGDIAAFLAGATDDQRILQLAAALMALRNWPSDHATQRPNSDAEPEAAWWAIRLACLPWPLDDQHIIPLDPAIIRRCACGDGSQAISLATRRLGAHGLRCAFRGGMIDPTLSRRWAAALAFPITRTTAQRAAAVISPSYTPTRSSPQGV